MARPKFEPSKAEREMVSLHATIGTPQEVIADILDIDPTTLRRHFRKELDQSFAKANATIGGALYNKAKGGDTAAMIFWMKTRAQWIERATEQADNELVLANALKAAIDKLPG